MRAQGFDKNCGPTSKAWPTRRSTLASPRIERIEGLEDWHTDRQKRNPLKIEMGGKMCFECCHSSTAQLSFGSPCDRTHLTPTRSPALLQSRTMLSPRRALLALLLAAIVCGSHLVAAGTSNNCVNLRGLTRKREEVSTKEESEPTTKRPKHGNKKKQLKGRDNTIRAHDYSKLSTTERRKRYKKLCNTRRAIVERHGGLAPLSHKLYSHTQPVTSLPC